MKHQYECLGINVKCKRQGREEEERMIFYAFCDPVVRRELLLGNLKT